jgi:hypothetical protein
MLTYFQSAMSEAYLSNAIQRIDKALLNTKLIDESLSNVHQMELAAVLVGVLLEFLRGKSFDPVCTKWLLSYPKQKGQRPRDRPAIFRTVLHLLVV